MLHLYWRRYLLPDDVLTTCPAFGEPLTGDVVIFVPVLYPLALLTIPVMEPSLFCWNLDKIGMPSFAAAVSLLPNKENPPEAFFGSAFLSAIVPERRSGLTGAFFGAALTGAFFGAALTGAFFGATFLSEIVPELGLAGAAAGELGELPKKENGFGAGAGAGSGAGAAFGVPKKEKGAGFAAAGAALGAGAGATFGATLGVELPKKEKGAGLAVTLGATLAVTLGTTLAATLGAALAATLGAGAGLPKKEKGAGFAATGVALGAGATFGATLGAELPKKEKGAGFAVAGAALGAGAGATFAAAFGATLGAAFRTAVFATGLTGSGLASVFLIGGGGGVLRTRIASC